MKRYTAAVVVGLSLAPVTASLAQTGARDSAFVDLRGDGNGFPRLASIVSIAIERQNADVALRRVAATARLNLTLDPHLAGLSTIVSVAAHDRTAATALIEIGDAAGLRLRVSSAGQLIVVASPPRATAETGSAVALPRVVTEAQSIERADFVSRAQIGRLSLTGEALNKTPVFVEPDVLRAVQLLPGVEARSDYTAGFNVRGGENDQNLVLIDGFPIYNPYHLGGVFSTFIDPTVGRIDLLRGSLPAQYGGRLSGVLDVRSAEPTEQTVRTSAEVSLLSATAAVGRAFNNDAGSWMVAARRTYVDAVASLTPWSFPYHFRDVQGHLVRDIGGGVRLSTTLYHGIDEIRDSHNTNSSADWGNSVVGLGLAKKFGASRLGGMSFDSITAEQRLSVTRFASHGDVLDEAFHVSDQVTEDRVAGALGFHKPAWSQTFGYDVTWQRLAYESNSINVTLADFIPIDTIVQHASSISLFADQLWRPSSRLVVQAGLRFDDVREARWTGFSPRVSLKYFVDSNTAVNVGGGRYAQWMHSLGRDEEPIQLIQFWVASDSVLPVSRSRDLVAGIEHWFSPRRFVHLEAFHKHYDDVMRPNPFNDPGKHGDEFAPVSGASYGVDLLARQISGRFTGWLAYTYAHSTRTAADGSEFYPPQDRRHNINVVGSWRLGSNTLGVHLALASGLPTTPVLGVYTRYRYDALDQKWNPDYSPNDGYITGRPGSVRLPWYQRVDVSVTHPFIIKGVAFDTYLSVLNVFNFKNPASYLYDFGSRPDRYTFPNLPITPTFGVKFAF